MNLEFIKEKMDKCFTFFVLNLQKININKINPTIFDSMKVVCYGNKINLQDVTFIKALDFRTLLITPFDVTQTKEIYKSLTTIKDLSLSFSISDNNVIRAVLPSLTEQTRLLFIKKVKDEVELTKIHIRNIRREGNLKIQNLLKIKEINKTEEKVLLIEIQFLTDSFIKKITVESSEKIKKLESL